MVECCGGTNDIEWKILDACRTVEKVMTIEAIYISKLNTALNTRDEYKGRKFSLNFSSNHNFDRIRIHRAKKIVHDKTRFAKPPQEGYLGLGQIRNTLKNKKHRQNRKIRNRNVFKEIDNRCMYEL